MGVSIETFKFVPENGSPGDEAVMPAYSNWADALTVSSITVRNFADNCAWLKLEPCDPREDRSGGRWIPKLRSNHNCFSGREISVWVGPEGKIAHIVIESKDRALQIDHQGREKEIFKRVS